MKRRRSPAWARAFGCCLTAAAVILLLLGYRPAFSGSDPQAAPMLAGQTEQIRERLADSFGAPGPGGAERRSTLVLFDEQSALGPVGEAFGVEAANLASRTGRVALRPVADYTQGDMQGFSAVIYAGTGSPRMLPTAFLDDVANTSTPVIWLAGTAQELRTRHPDAPGVQGWTAATTPAIPVDVDVRGVRLTRSTAAGNKVARVDLSSGADVEVLATVGWPDGTRTPWAVRSNNFTFVAEPGLDYVSLIGDRVLALADIILRTTGPEVPERHRALLRIDGVNPTTDPDRLRRIVDRMAHAGVPMSLAIDPVGAGRITLADNPRLAEVIRYALTRGTSLVLSRPDRTDASDDPSAGLAAGEEELARAGLPRPLAVAFPGSRARASTYRSVNESFGMLYDQPSFFGYCAARPCAYGTTGDDLVYDQQLPYAVRDARGMVIVPYNLGHLAPDNSSGEPVRGPADIVAGAAALMVVRDSVASFSFHAYLDPHLLEETVRGVLGLGYRFVSPLDVVMDRDLSAAPQLVP